MNERFDRSKVKERYAAGKMRQHSTRALFFIGGFGAASWAPLVPLLRERLAIGEDVLGMLLLCIGIGSLLTMPLSGAAAVRFGCRKTLSVAATVFALFLLVLCQVDNMVLAAVSLLVFGAMMGCIDVVINIQAVLVEKAAKRRLMSGMHALWSVGGFIGAGLFGIWVGTLGLTPLISTCIAVGIMLLTLAFFARHLLPFGGEGGGAMVAIPRGIVAFVGVVACIAFLMEGAIMDWSGVFLTTVRGFDLSLAGMGFTVFSAAMLVMRLLGDVTVQWLGQKPVVVVVETGRPLVLAEIEPYADAVLLSFNVQHQALLDLISGHNEPSALLPMQMPADMAAVEAQLEDVPRDMRCYRDADGHDYDFAFGMNWSGVISDERVKKYK